MGLDECSGGGGGMEGNGLVEWGDLKLFAEAVHFHVREISLL